MQGFGSVTGGCSARVGVSAERLGQGPSQRRWGPGRRAGLSWAAAPGRSLGVGIREGRGAGSPPHSPASGLRRSGKYME